MESENLFRIFTDGNKLSIIAILVKELGQKSVLSDNKRSNSYVVRCTKEQAESIVANHDWALRFEKHVGASYIAKIE